MPKKIGLLGRVSVRPYEFGQILSIVAPGDFKVHAVEESPIPGGLQLIGTIELDELSQPLHKELTRRFVMLNPNLSTTCKVDLEMNESLKCLLPVNLSGPNGTGWLLFEVVTNN